MASKTRKAKKENIVYAASRALIKSEKKATRKIGPLTRIIACIRESLKAHKDMRGKSWWIHEKKRARYRAIFADTCSPVYNAWLDLWDNAYNFLTRFFSDLGALAIDIANIFIVIGFTLQSVALFISDWIADIAYWCEGRKKALLGVFVGLTIAGVGAAIFITSITAYQYSYYGRVLGVAKSKKMVYDTIEVLGDKLAENTGANVSINVERDIEFTPVHGFKLRTDREDDILNALTYMKDLQVDAFAIAIDGRQEVILENEVVARDILTDIKDGFAQAREGVEYTDIHFVNDIKIEPVNVKLGDLWNASEAEHYLLTGAARDRIHILDRQEGLDDLLANYDMTREDLEKANPNLDLDNLSQGMEICMTVPNPKVIITSTEIATYHENIQYGSQYIDNGAIYEGETEVRSPGIYGQNEIVATVTRINGNETSREIMSTTKLSNPVDEVLYRGTKPIPEKIGTGTFELPIRNYYVSSHRGMRWGRMHEGIDLAAQPGTKIYASDGGKVIFSGWNNALGYCIKIDHGGLYTTVYGHCSRLLVSVGDMVFQGQNIALVGSTGNSTGPHLHFEIRYNGNAKDPEDYLKF